VSWWGFNGNANDGSSNGLNGTPIGVTLTDDRFSNPNSAYLFDSSQTEIDCGNSPLLDLNECSYSAWVLLATNSPGTYQTILAKWDSDSTCDFSLTLDGGILHAFFVGSINPPQYVDLVTNTSLQINQWYHVVTTHSFNNGLKTYINGVLDASNATSFNINPLIVGDHFRIGSQGPFSPFPMQFGKIDDVGVWNRELDQTEVTALFNSSTSVGEINDGYQISSFPNPFSTYATIQSSQKFNNASLTLYNAFGQVVKQMDQLSVQSIMVYRDDLAAGLYYYLIMQENKVVSSDKLIISDN
jgi:hypothetical protein